MSRFRPFGITSVISTTGTSCLSLFQLVLSDLPCEENEMCEHYHGQNSNSWYIWCLLLIFLVVLLCGIMCFCFQCWLKRRQIDCSRRTVAVFVVGDLDPMDEKDMKEVLPRLPILTADEASCPRKVSGTSSKLPESTQRLQGSNQAFLQYSAEFLLKQLNLYSK